MPDSNSLTTTTKESAREREEETRDAELRRLITTLKSESCVTSSEKFGRLDLVDTEDAVSLWSAIVGSELTTIEWLRDNLKWHKLRLRFGFFCEPMPSSSGANATRFRITKVILNFSKFEQVRPDFSTQTLFLLLAKRLPFLREIGLVQWKPFSLIDTLSCFPCLKTLMIESREILFDKPTCTTLDCDMQLECLSLSLLTPLNEKGLENFFFDVLPVFPKLEFFAANFDSVPSFHRIANRIRNESSKTIKSIPTTKFRNLSLNTSKSALNEYREKLQNDPQEVEALKTILSAFPQLQGYQFYKVSNGTCPDIEHLLNINRAGHVLVPAKQKTNRKTATPVIPLSVWPIVFHRAWKQVAFRVEGESYSWNWKAPDAIYFLLRNGAVLQEISEGKRKRSNLKSSLVWRNNFWNGNKFSQYVLAIALLLGLFGWSTRSPRYMPLLEEL